MKQWKQYFRVPRTTNMRFNDHSKPHALFSICDTNIHTNSPSFTHKSLTFLHTNLEWSGVEWIFHATQ